MKNLFVSILVGLLALGCGPAEKKADITPSEFEANYDLYASVLQKHVQGEAVDYAALKNDRADLDKFIGLLAGLTMEEYDSMTSGEQLALWINAYNAVLLRTIIDSYPVTSVKDIEGATDGAGWEIAGKTVTLDNIRDDIIRAGFGDARALIALSCAAVDGPVLSPVPYKGEMVDDQLDGAVHNFVNDVHRNKINPHTGTITANELFVWYATDVADQYGTDEFAHLKPSDRAVFAFILANVDESIVDFIDESAGWQIEYKPFDWSLNDVKH